MEEAKTLIERIAPLTAKAQELLMPLFTPMRVEKGTEIVRIHQKNEQEYIIASGIIRSYVLNPEGKEVTLSFFLEGKAILPNIVRTKGNQSNINLQALTEVELYSFSSIQLIELMVQHIEIREWANAILQTELIVKTEKELAQASMTAKQRLVKFREDYPGLENQISHPHIASYLGITNISLSRLRKELMLED